MVSIENLSTKIKEGVFTNGIASIFSSFLRNRGLGVANNNVGLAAATKVTSRYACIATGILFILFVFIPKIATFPESISLKPTQVSSPTAATCQRSIEYAVSDFLNNLKGKEVDLLP